MNITETVKQLLIINILFFIGSQLVPASYDILALHFIENDKFQYWQPFTHMFMHAKLPSIWHIAFNMFALYSFGSAIEYQFGVKKFLFFYISCGLFGALLYMGINYYQFHESIQPLIDGGLSENQIINALNTRQIDSFNGIINQIQFNRIDSSFSGSAVGASGAIYGLLVAFAMLYPNAELSLMFIPVPIKAKYFVPAWIFLFDICYGIIFNGNSGVAHTAHLGGAMCGFIMMWYWKKNQFNDKRWN